MKSFYAGNDFLPNAPIPYDPVNLVQNGGFETDGNGDGLADGWRKGGGVTASIVTDNGSFVQKAVAASAGMGIDQEWISISDQKRYTLRAKLKVLSGTVRFWHYDVMSGYTAAGNGTVASVGATGGQFVEKELTFAPQPGAARTSVRFWPTGAAEFLIDDVELIEAGPVATIAPPRTEITVVLRRERPIRRGRTNRGPGHRRRAREDGGARAVGQLRAPGGGAARQAYRGRRRGCAAAVRGSNARRGSVGIIKSRCGRGPSGTALLARAAHSIIRS